MALSFDATYYLNARPDVFHAFVATAGATGKTWAQFAEEHYNTFGRFEGANPNATFNTDEYLAANPDVAAAGVNPFTHYLHFGAAEGRAPSNSFPSFASFDSAAYLAANPDLGAAGIDTPNEAYAHFVIFGQFESRPGAPAVDTGVPGVTKALTTGVDVLDGTSGNDTFVGYINTTAASTDSTFTAADFIDGKAGTDTLTLTVAGNGVGTLPVATIQNVEKFHIRDLSTGGGSTYNFAGVIGETEVWSDRSSAAVNFTNLGAGTVVGIKGDGVAAIGAVGATFATAVTSASVVVDGGIVGGTTNVTLGNPGIETVTLSSTGAANALGTVDLSTSTSVKALTVNASTNFSATLVGTDYVATGAELKVAGNAASVNLGTAGIFKTVDASALKGGLTIQTSGVTASVKGGAGADVITLAGLTATGTVNLGAGDDRLIGTAAPAATVGTIDGGEGRDSVASGLINAGNGAKFVNFEILELGSNTLDVALLTGSAIDTLSLAGAGAGGGTFSNVANTVKVDVSSTTAGTTAIGVAGAGANAADALSINFVGKAAATATAIAPTGIAAGTLTLADIENINVYSSGTGFVSNTLVVNGATGLQTLTVTGDKALGLSFSGVNGKAPVGGDAVNGVKLIDASAATGDITVNTANLTNIATAGLTVNTGAGNDTITLAKKATVNAGAGDDSIIVTANASGATLTGGDGKDVFNLSAAVFGTGTLEGATSTVNFITDFTAGDKIVVATAGTGAVLGAAKDISAAATLAEAFDIANGGAATTGVSWFQYAGSTYIVDDINASSAVSADDILVKLVGAVDLSTATLSAAGEIAFA